MKTTRRGLFALFGLGAAAVALPKPESKAETPEPLFIDGELNFRDVDIVNDGTCNWVFHQGGTIKWTVPQNPEKWISLND